MRLGRNIKYLSLRMGQDEKLFINIPYGCSQKQVYDFLENNQTWIEQTKQKINLKNKNIKKLFSIDSTIATKFFKINIRKSPNSKLVNRLEGKEVDLAVPDGVDLDLIVNRTLLIIYELESIEYLPKRVDYLAKKFNFQYRELKFRNNVSNWGSCSQDNNISLNIKLMQASWEAIDYVILHELCHTIEKNHSARFWQLVENVCPDYKNLKEELSKYSKRI